MSTPPTLFMWYDTFFYIPCTREKALFWGEGYVRPFKRTSCWVAYIAFAAAKDVACGVMRSVAKTLWTLIIINITEVGCNYTVQRD